MGNGRDISFWLDNWHPSKPPIEKYGKRVFYNSDLKRYDKVSKIIRDGLWFWPHASTWELRDICNSLLSASRGGEDIVKWGTNNAGFFSIKKAWDILRKRKPIVNWSNLLWFKCHTPKHSIILWLVIRNRLQTKDKFYSLGIVDNLYVDFVSLKRNQLTIFSLIALLLRKFGGASFH